MQQAPTFAFAPGLTLRAALIATEPWLVAKDVCEALGFDTDRPAWGSTSPAWMQTR